MYLRRTPTQVCTLEGLPTHKLPSEALYVGTALLGIGMASIFATGFLWVERRMKVTARIGSAFLVASSSGADVFPLVVGQLVEDHPMGFVFLFKF